MFWLWIRRFLLFGYKCFKELFKGVHRTYLRLVHVKIGESYHVERPDVFDLDQCIFFWRDSSLWSGFTTQRFEQIFVDRVDFITTTEPAAILPDFVEQWIS